MKEYLTLDVFLNLPLEILKISKKESINNKLIDKKDHEIYNKFLKKDLIKYFESFIEFKYVLQYSEEKCIRDYELKENKLIRNVNSRVEKSIEKKQDYEVYVLETYNKMIDLAYKLTYEEAVYFVNVFFGNKTDEEISKKLKMCVKTLYKFKKSCLVKTFLEFPC